MTFADLLQLSNVLIIPALGYIIMLERRLMRLEVRLEVLLSQLSNGGNHEKAQV